MNKKESHEEWEDMAGELKPKIDEDMLMDLDVIKDSIETFIKYYPGESRDLGLEEIKIKMEDYLGKFNLGE